MERRVRLSFDARQPLVGVDIIKVKELLGHRRVTTTQIYDKQRYQVNNNRFCTRLSLAA
jgi:site-specific recombinase XerD